MVSSLIEHEIHPSGVSKLFFERFINTSWAYFKNFALLSLRYSATFRRSGLVLAGWAPTHAVSSSFKNRINVTFSILSHF